MRRRARVVELAGAVIADRFLDQSAARPDRIGILALDLGKDRHGLLRIAVDGQGALADLVDLFGRHAVQDELAARPAAAGRQGCDQGCLTDKDCRFPALHHSLAPPSCLSVFRWRIRRGLPRNGIKSDRA